MIEFIYLFFPAVLSVWIYESVGKQNLSKKSWIYRFCTNTMIVNFVCFLFKKVFLGTASLPIYNLYTDTDPSTALNYMIITVPTAILLGFVEVVLSKHVKIEAQNDD